MPPQEKIVVFDMDETLGYFTQLYMIWKVIVGSNQGTCFNKLLDAFPEYIRPMILVVLRYLKTMKSKRQCKQVMIYTNNQRKKDWVMKLKRYFEDKVGDTIFDQVIGAFMINGQLIEPGRTTHEKTHTDFVSCSQVPPDTQICFIDDTYFQDMHTASVYYIKVKPYVYNLGADTIVKRLQAFDMTPVVFRNIAIAFSLGFQAKTAAEYEIDKIIGKELMNQIQQFFRGKWYEPTRRKRIRKKNQTQKVALCRL
jgi:hypothetical protein